MQNRSQRDLRELLLKSFCERLLSFSFIDTLKGACHIFNFSFSIVTLQAFWIAYSNWVFDFWLSYRKQTVPVVQYCKHFSSTKYSCHPSQLNGNNPNLGIRNKWISAGRKALSYYLVLFLIINHYQDFYFMITDKFLGSVGLVQCTLSSTTAIKHN